MSEMQWIILLGKIVCIAALASLAGWVAIYTRLAKWWRNPIGRTLVTKTLLIAALLLPTTINLFFTLNPIGVAWVDIALIGAITPVMIWRSVVWMRLGRDQGETGHD